MKFLLYMACISFCFQIHASDICFVKTFSNGVQEITLPGKKLYGLFTPHLRDEPRKIHTIFSRTISSKKDEEDLSKDLRVFLSDHIEMAEREKKDISDLLDLLRSNPDIQWIGIESSKKEEADDPRTIEDRIEGYHQIKDFLLNKGILNPEETKNLLHLRFSQEIVALAEYPELFRSKEFFIPLDDDVYKEASHRVEKITGHIWEELVFNRSQQLLNTQFQLKENCQDVRCIDNVERELDSIISQMNSVGALVESADKIISQEQIAAALNEIEG